MSSGKKIAQFLALKDLKLVFWRQTGIACNEAHCLKQSKGEVCPKCARFSSSIYDHRKVRIKDEPIRGKAVVLIIKKRRFYCKACRKPFTEPVAGILPRKRTTQRLAKSVTNACKKYSSLKDVCRDYRCSSSFVYSVFYKEIRRQNKQRLNYPWPKTIGIDEHFFSRQKGYREFFTVLVDYTNKRPRELVLGRVAAHLEQELKHIDGRENVRNVIMDLSRPYKAFTRSFFPNARIVADKFHVIRLLNNAINRYRKKYTGDKRSLAIRKLLLCSAHKLDYFKRRAILQWLADKPDLEEVYQYKEALLRFYRTKGLGRARRALNKLTDQMALSELPEIKRLRRTLRTWSTEILNYFSTGLTNARTEGFNNLAKTVQKRAYGYKNPENYKHRFLNACL